MPAASTPDARPALSLADLEAFDTPQGRDPEKRCRCPICQSSERAFHFNTTTGAFNCKRASCGVRGKLSDFWQERPNQSRKQREKSRLSAAFSLAPRDCSPNAANALQSATAREETAPATAATWQTLFAQSQPASGTAAVDYLTRRGIPETTGEAANARVLRFHPGGYRRDYVVFPFCDCDGVPVAFQARAIDGEADGHRAYGTKSAGVFSTCADALKADTVILCEAPIDALSLAACGFEAVALGGTSAPAWIAKTLAFKRVYLAFDNDQNGAGDNAAAKLAPDLQSFGATALRLAPLREVDTAKSDWNMMLLQHGPTALRAWLVARLAHLAHFQTKSEGGSTPSLDESNRQTEQIRALAEGASGKELLAAYQKIKPFLKAQLNSGDLHELALLLARADKSNANIFSKIQSGANENV